MAVKTHFQHSFFAHKSDNLQQLVKNIPERFRKDILTSEVVKELPDKYKKSIPMDLPTFASKKSL